MNVTFLRFRNEVNHRFAFGMTLKDLYDQVHPYITDKVHIPSGNKLVINEMVEVHVTESDILLRINNRFPSIIRDLKVFINGFPVTAVTNMSIFNINPEVLIEASWLDDRDDILYHQTLVITNVS